MASRGLPPFPPSSPPFPSPLPLATGTHAFGGLLGGFPEQWLLEKGCGIGTWDSSLSEHEPTFWVADTTGLESRPPTALPFSLLCDLLGQHHTEDLAWLFPLPHPAFLG